MGLRSQTVPKGEIWPVRGGSHRSRGSQFIHLADLVDPKYRGTNRDRTNRLQSRKRDIVSLDRLIQTDVALWVLRRLWSCHVHRLERMLISVSESLSLICPGLSKSNIHRDICTLIKSFEKPGMWSRSFNLIIT